MDLSRTIDLERKINSQGRAEEGVIDCRDKGKGKK